MLGKLGGQAALTPQEPVKMVLSPTGKQSRLSGGEYDALSEGIDCLLGGDGFHGLLLCWMDKK